MSHNQQAGQIAPPTENAEGNLAAEAGEAAQPPAGAAKGAPPSRTRVLARG